VLQKLCVLLAIGLLVLVPNLALAEGAIPPAPPETIEEDWVGWTDASKLSTGSSNRLTGSRGSINLPSLGQAWAESRLGWASLRMDGMALTWLTNSPIDWYVASRVKKVYKNGAGQCESGHVGWWTKAGPVEAKCSVYGWVYGATWRVDTSHLVTNFTNFEWGPQLSVSVTL
jgi:hypothetical protein